jgi:uncharacterized membrane protein
MGVLLISLPNSSKFKFLILILFLIISVTATVTFDLQVSRQVIVFIFLTFVPGILILRMLRLEGIDVTEKALLSVGISLIFVMLTGLLANELFPLVGLLRPLSAIPLLIEMCSLVIVFAAMAFSKNDGLHLLRDIDTKRVLQALLLAIIPALTILGTALMNTSQNNTILLIVTFAIPLLFAISVFSKKLLPSSLYPLFLFVISLSLLYRSSLISNYVVSFGSDSHLELFVFKTTLNNAFWNPNNLYPGDLSIGRVSSMLGITVLPTVYSSLLNLDPTWVMKLLYPFIFSLVPVCLFQVWKPHFGEKVAFLSAFFLIAEATFYNEMLGVNRQIIAEVFFVLLLLVIFNSKMKPVTRKICFVLFSVGLITSHYGLAEIFLFFILTTFVFLLATKKTSGRISMSMVLFFLVSMFAWYLFTSSGSVFESITGFLNFMGSQLGSFFNPTARGGTVLEGLGVGSAATIWNAIHRGIVYATEFFIAVGSVGLVTRRFIKSNMNREYYSFTILSIVILALCVILPGFANTLNVTRFYHILLFFLAPLGVIGAGILVKLVSRRRVQTLASILMLIVLASYFLFESGFVFEITRTDSWSPPLSEYRMSPFRLYAQLGFVDGQSVASALWLTRTININGPDINVYADDNSRSQVLLSYGLVYPGYVAVLSNTTQAAANGIIYLSTLNDEYGTIVANNNILNSSALSPLLGDASKIYSNGGSEVYKLP